jgi:hypothetical protein
MNDMANRDFDKATTLHSWRAALLSHGGLSSGDVDELQDHLEHVELELSTYLTPEEAFWVAAHRIGTPHALTREYGKVRPNAGWLLRAQWALLGLLAYWLLVPAANAVVYAIIAALAAVPALTALAAAGRLFTPSLGLILSFVALACVVRRWGGQPEAFERALRSHGLPARWTLLFALATFSVWQAGLWFASSTARSFTDRALYTPGMPAPLQSTAWPIMATALTYLLPAVVFLLVVRIQQLRSETAVTE